MRLGTIRKRIFALLLCLAVSGAFAQIPDAAPAVGTDLQGLDAATLAQIMASGQYQGLQGVGTQGTAPAVGKTADEVKALQVSGQAGGVQAAATGSGGTSSVERMFGTIALALGTSAAEQIQYGYSLFEKPTAPSLAAIGDDYTLGPGDAFVLYLWGDPVDLKEISASYTLTVDRNGSVFLPPAGQLSVWGQDLGQVRALIKGILDKRFKRLEMSLTLSTLRQFPVYVSGYAGNPGTVLATGADTVATVLSRAGGVKKTGSLRRITLTRQEKGGAVTKELDFYDTLIAGKSVDLRVREGDSIFVPGIGPAVSLSGELKRPGIYELKGEANLASALELAGGALPSARSASVTLLRFGPGGKTLGTGDLSDKAFASTKAMDGDLILFGRVSDLLVGQVQISGPAKYAGRYDSARYPGLRALLVKSEILAETNLFYGRVYRMDASGRDRSFAFSPRDVLAGSDLALQEFDRVVLYRYDDTRIDPDFDRFRDTLVVSGPVRYPGFYLYREGMKLSRLMADNILALDANRWYADITRTTATGAQEYLTFSPESVLSGKADLDLKPLDRVRFVRRGEEAKGHDFNRFPQAVYLSGQLRQPEVYALEPGMKLSGILTRDQILLDTNLNYAEIIRLESDGRNRYATFMPDELLSGARDYELGPRDVIRLVKAGFNPAAPDFDRFSETVQLTGPVLFPGLYAWREGMTLADLVRRANLRLTANRYYAEIVRPLPGGRFEYKTFSPREVEAGTYDTPLQARDSVKIYAMPPAVVALGQRVAAKDGKGVALKQEAAAQVAAAAAPGTPPAAAPATVTAQTAGPAPTAATAPAAPAPEGADISGTAEAILAGREAGGEGDVAGANVVERFMEVVTVTGSVRYAGPYARTSTLTLAGLVTPDQILEDTNLDYAELTRFTEDGGYQFMTFSPREVLEKKYDLPLKARDAVNFARKTFFGGALAPTNVQKFADVVRLTGQIARPEVFALRPGTRLSALLTRDQILLDTNLNYAEIHRYRADGKDEYFTFRPADILGGVRDFDLNQRDMVTLYRVGYSPARPDFDRYGNAVQVLGAVRFGGMYAWTEGDTLSSLMKLSGLRLDTYRYYAEISRPVGSGRYEYLTFAPREIEQGSSDLALKARDTVVFFTAQPAVATGKPGAAKQDETAAPGAASAPVAVVTTIGDTPVVEAPQVGESAGGVDLARNLEVVIATGSIRYTGPYARTSRLTLASIITPDQILDDTNLEYAELTRLTGDGGYEYLTFSPRDVLEKKYDLALRARDTLRFTRKTAFGGTLPPVNVQKFADVVRLAGQIARPEVFALKAGARLSGLLGSDQILLDTNLNYAEIHRYRPDGKDEYVTFSPAELLAGTWDFELRQRDEVTFHRVGYSPAAPDFDRYADAVQVVGAVRFGGLYAWKPGATLSSLMKLSGLRLDTNLYYAEIARPLGSGRFEYITFAPREIKAGGYDQELKARDRITFFNTQPATQAAKPGSGKPEEPATAPVADGAGMAKGAPAIGATTGTALGAAGAPKTDQAALAVAPAVPGAPAAAAALPLAIGDLPMVEAPQSGESASGVDLARPLEVVVVSGSIRYAGPYARTPTLTLASIITPDQVLQDTNLDYAELARRKPDGGFEYTAFSPREVLRGAFDLPLRAQDYLRFVRIGYLPEKPDFDRFDNSYALMGAARFPGLYAMDGPVPLSRIVVAEQLLGATDINYGEIERWVPGGKTEYLTFNPLAVILGAQETRIFPRDIVRLLPAGGDGTKHDFGRYPDTVVMKGTLRRPGRLAWYEGMTLGSVFAPEDLLIDTDPTYAEIRRREADKESMLSFSPAEAAAGKTDILLKPRDVISFYPKFAQAPVTVSGEVKTAKVIPYYDGMELSAVLRSVELGSAFTDLKATLTKAAGGSADYYLEDYLRTQATRKVPLAPGDAVSIKRLLPDEHLATVAVRGAVRSPQSIAYEPGMRLADALAASGGYQGNAYPFGLVLIRRSAAEQQQKQVDRLVAQFESALSGGTGLGAAGSSGLSSTSIEVANLQIDLIAQRTRLGQLKQLYKEGFGRISLDIPDSLDALRASAANVLLERDDFIFVPSTPTYVLVAGEVADQSIVAYTGDLTVGRAIEQAGWVSASGDVPAAYIIRASGRMESTAGKGFWIFRPDIRNMRLRPGDTVFVPAKSARISMGWAYAKDILTIVSTILTAAVTTVALLGL